MEQSGKPKTEPTSIWSISNREGKNIQWVKTVYSINVEKIAYTYIKF